MIKTALIKVLDSISAALFVIKAVFAVPTVMGYPITMMAGLALFIYAFRGDPLILLFWLAIFATLTVLLVGVSFTKAKKWSLGWATFFILCQTVILGFACNMAFFRFYQVWINVLTSIVLTSFVLAQLSLWWLRRHYAEVWQKVKAWPVWQKIKAWFTKHFGRTPAGTHSPAFAALGGAPTPAATPAPTPPGLGGGTSTPPP